MVDFICAYRYSHRINLNMNFSKQMCIQTKHKDDFFALLVGVQVFDKLVYLRAWATNISMQYVACVLSESPGSPTYEWGLSVNKQLNALTKRYLRT